jgi:hypothetical protein
VNEDGPIVGADTETFNGAVKLLAFSDGTYVEPSSADYTDLCLDALYSASREARWVVFWNLGFDVAAILKPWVVAHADTFRATHYANIARRKRLRELEAEEVDRDLRPEELHERQELAALLDGEDNIERFDTDRFHVVLIGAKAMSLTPRQGKTHHHTKAREWFFDAAAWYSSSFGGVSLDYAAHKFLGEGKTNADLGIDRSRIGSEAGYYEKHRDDILSYCIQDGRLTARLMERTVEAFKELGYPFPEKPFSRASVSREYLKEKHVLDATAARYEKLKDNSYASLWVKSFRGGVFVLMGAGHWVKPFALDLNSAYPDAMVRFPSLEDAVVVDGRDPRFKECFFTFHHVKLRPTPRSPTRDAGETRKIYGWVNEETTLCLTGIDLAVLRSMGEEVEVVKECGIYTPHPNDKPLAYLQEVYDRKSEVKRRYGSDSKEYANLKILLNGTYGILAQRRPRESRWTNLIYASYVTAWCRRKLWEAVLETEERGDYVVSLATDGLMVHGERSRAWWAAQHSNELGAWSYTTHDDAVCYENGVGFLDEFEVKKRGMPSLTKAEMVKCSENSWSETSQRPLKLRSALIQKRTEFLGVFEDHVRTLCPVKSYYDAGMSFPRELLKAPLSSFFTKAWHLRLRGQVGDRLTPPRAPAERARWEAMLRRSTHERGYIYPSRRSSRRNDSSAKHAEGTTPEEEPSGAVETNATPPSVEKGSAKRERQADRPRGVGAHPPSGGRDSQVAHPSETETRYEKP